MKKNPFREIEIYSADLTTHLPLPWADEGIRAGFPSAAQDYLERTIDLNTALIQHSEATFYGTVKGDSMIEAGYHDGDILIIDRAIEPNDGDTVIAFVEGEFTVKRLDLSERDKGIVWLRPANPAYPPFKMDIDSQFEVWGVVTYHITKDRKG